MRLLQPLPHASCGAPARGVSKSSLPAPAHSRPCARDLPTQPMYPPSSSKSLHTSLFNSAPAPLATSHNCPPAQWIAQPAAPHAHLSARWGAAPPAPAALRRPRASGTPALEHVGVCEWRPFPATICFCCTIPTKDAHRCVALALMQHPSTRFATAKGSRPPSPVDTAALQHGGAWCVSLRLEPTWNQPNWQTSPRAAPRHEHGPPINNLGGFYFCFCQEEPPLRLHHTPSNTVCFKRRGGGHC